MLRPPSYYQNSSATDDCDSSKKLNPQRGARSTSNQSDIAINDIACTSSPHDQMDELRRQIDLLTIELNRSELSYSTQIRELNEQITLYLTDIQVLKSAQDQRGTQFLSEKHNLEEKFSNEIELMRGENNIALERMKELEILLSRLESEKQDLEQKIYLENEENTRLKLSLNSITTYPDREESYKISIEELTTQLEHETKQIQFLNLRLEALQDILKLQEKNMVQNSTESFENVLTTWRGKVFELLMRERIIKYNSDQNQRLINKEFECFTERIARLENESDLQKLSINEKSAQVASLSEEIILANCSNSKLLNCVSCYRESDKTCKVNLTNILTQLRTFSDTIDNLCGKKLTVFGNMHHRIMFISERVSFLVGYLTNHQSRLKPQREVATQTIFPDSCLVQNEQIDSERINLLSHGTLVNEVQLLIRDRSILQNKLRDSSDMAMRKFEVMCENTNLEKEKLLSEISELNFDKNKLIEENGVYQEDLEKFKLDCEKNEDIRNDLERELEQNKREHEKQRKDILEELQARHSESLKDLDNRLREMCQNYTEQQEKARIAENNTQREVDLAVRNFQIENQDLKRKLEEMRIHLQAVESEKIMLSRSLQTLTTTNSSLTHPCPLTKNISIQTMHKVSSVQPLENYSFHPDNESSASTDHRLVKTKESNPASSNHMVSASELYSLVQDITELSSHVLSM